VKNRVKSKTLSSREASIRTKFEIFRVCLLAARSLRMRVATKSNNVYIFSVFLVFFSVFFFSFFFFFERVEKKWKVDISNIFSNSEFEQNSNKIKIYHIQYIYNIHCMFIYLLHQEYFQK
jgi:hypothetical protein